MMAETSNLNLNGGRGIKSAYAVDKVNGQDSAINELNHMMSAGQDQRPR